MPESDDGLKGSGRIWCAPAIAALVPRALWLDTARACDSLGTMLKLQAFSLVLLSACAGASPQPGARDGSAPASASAPAAATAPGTPDSPDTPAGATADTTREAAPKHGVAACGPEIAGAGAVIAPGAIVMLGEMHGSREIPAFTGNLACRAAMAGHAVIVGLEIPQVEQAAINRYLASGGSTRDREALVAGAHWRRPEQDGRSSRALVDLIERVRALRQSGHKVEVLAFDNARYDAWNERDAGMAQAILGRAKAAPEAFVVTLSGNLHNRTEPGLPWDQKLVPMGVHVKAGHARTLSLDARYEGGKIWMCEAERGCGEHALEVKDQPYDERTIDTSEAARRPGSDGVFFVGTLSASPPAVPAAPAAGPASPPAKPAAGPASPAKQ